MNEILVFPCGTLVKTKLSNIEGMITTLNISFTKVIYEIKYFNNGEQKSIWMNEKEFEASSEKVRLGFIK